MTPPISSVPAEALLPEALRLERLLPELSALFSALAPQAIDDAIDQALERIVSTLDIDRSTLNRVFPLTGRAEVTHSYAVEGVAPVPKRLTAAPSMARAQISGRRPASAATHVVDAIVRASPGSMSNGDLAGTGMALRR